MKSHKTLLFVIATLLSFQVFGQSKIALPDIPATQFNITDYGANTSSLDNSSAINAAITAANNAGGGTVVFPEGRFLSGPITMKSNVNLYFATGDTLEMMPYGDGNGSPEGSYPNDGTTDSYQYFIYGENLHNIEVSGSGLIDGNGSAWWTAYEANSNIRRPYLIRFKACDTVLITGINLTTGTSTSCSTTSITNSKISDAVYCYPNPIKGEHFTVNDESGINKVRIYDISGHLVKEQIGDGTKHLEVQASRIPSGNYIVNIISKTGAAHSLKLIKE
ncbi:MAG: T9SS type A sorting domain-containing protein [Bacteroidales bacterium]|nr:T9SS type A sorting domain-containing protein [Bacteroidales bacterium]